MWLSYPQANGKDAQALSANLVDFMAPEFNESLFSLML
jgi:hypothetical protein